MPHVPSAKLSGSELQTADVLSCANARGTVRVDEAAYERVRLSWEAAVRIANRRPVYGRTTGVGANRDVVVTADVAQDLRLLRSHATGTGDWLSHKTVRAALIVRLNQLLVGGSGMHPGIVDGITAALDADDLPRVRSFGAIGTGDLSSFAEIGLGLAGYAQLESGRTHQYWKPRIGDALALISTNAMTVALGVTATAAAERWFEHGLAISCLSLIAVNGSVEALAKQVHTARPHDGQAETAALLRALLKGHHWTPVRIQDSYGFRAMAQVNGTVRQSVDAMRDVLETEINSASENPLISIEDDDVFHNANFHALPVALAYDHTKLAISSSAQLAACRLLNLSDPGITRLSPFLSDGPAGSSGDMLLEYNSAAALARLRASAAPATLGSTVISRGAEDHASFATQAADQLNACVQEATYVVACELIAALRALTQKSEIVDSATALGSYRRRAQERIDMTTADRPLGDDLAEAVSFLQQPTGLERIFSD